MHALKREQSPTSAAPSAPSLTTLAFPPLVAGHVEAAVPRQKCHSILKLLLAIWLLSCRTSYPTPPPCLCTRGRHTHAATRQRVKPVPFSFFPFGFLSRKRQPIAFCPALSGKVAWVVCVCVCVMGRGEW